MNEQEREAIIRENAKKTIRYHLHGMDAVVVRDTAYDAGGSEIPMAIYYPSAPAAGARLPVAIVAFGYADPEARVRQYGPMTSWPRLIAARMSGHNRRTSLLSFAGSSCWSVFSRDRSRRFISPSYRGSRPHRSVTTVRNFS